MEYRSDAIDRAGAVASCACAVHCLLCALLPGVLGAVGLGAVLGHEAEWGLTLVAVVFASTALWLGWRRHRSWSVVVALSVGVAGLLLSRLLEEAGGPMVGTALGILAGAVLVVGHVWNLRASRRCQAECT
ncbi:MAG: MerC domain-containing protein [Deltaproteobacteria bacterium]|nr:MerC domain-containing protein [Deltaproteobacteria bacterium]